METYGQATDICFSPHQDTEQMEDITQGPASSLARRSHHNVQVCGRQMGEKGKPISCNIMKKGGNGIGG